MVRERQPLEVVEKIGLEGQRQARVDSRLQVIARDLQQPRSEPEGNPEQDGEDDDRAAPSCSQRGQGLPDPVGQGSSEQAVVDQDLHPPRLHARTTMTDPRYGRR